MTPRYGRAETGRRVIDFVPHGHYSIAFGATTFLAALRHDGLTAPLVVDVAINGKIFLAWVKQELLPTLHQGDVVVMDNLGSHKVAGVKEAIECVGAKVLYLPPYSPGFNLMENERSRWRVIFSLLFGYSPAAVQLKTCSEMCDNKI